MFTKKLRPMSNLNLDLDLIEKVRKGEAAIEHTKKEEDIERLQYVLIKSFPNDDIHTKGNALYYYKYKDDKWSCDNTTHLEPIPLQSFFTNQLTPEDNKTIELIDKRLKQLNIDENSSVMLEFLCRPDISQKVVKMLDGEKQPSPAKDEVEYVRCVKSVLVFTEGHIYKLSSVSANNIEQFVMYNGIQWGSYEQYRMFFMPATKEEYQAKDDVEYYCMREQDGNDRCLNQCEYCKKCNNHQAQQQVEWKEQEWAWADKSKTILGIITKIYSGKNTFADINTQTEKYNIITGIYIEEFTKPTEQEIFNHLRGIAEKKYPVGTKVKVFDSQFVKINTGNEFTYSDKKLSMRSRETNDDVFWTIWQNGKWAEQVEDVKESDNEKISVQVIQSSNSGSKNWYVVVDSHYEDLTIQQANEIAQKIKQLLTNI